MDSTRFKRRVIQTKRQTVESTVRDRASFAIPVQIDSQKPTTPIVTVVPKIEKIPVIQVAPTVLEQQKQNVPKELSAPPLAKQAPRGRISMDLPGSSFSLYQAMAPIVKGKRSKAIRTWAFRSVVMFLVVTIGIGGLLFSRGYEKVHKVFKGNARTVAALTTNVNPQLLKGEGDGRINILLLGRGGGDHDGPDLTDTMMLASIDPVNHTSTLLSIPRDLWVDIANQGAMKVNAAWETGEFNYEGKIAPGSTDPKAIQAGFDQADDTVESVLGVTIDYNVIMDFAAFQQAVDTVGGVSIDVPTELYDPTMAWQNHNNPILAEPGVQSFNGAQTLNYVRSRETTSDFARSQRQRAVILALKQKVETLGTLSNPLKISGLLSAFGNNVSTDLSLSDAGRLYDIVKSIDNSKVTSIGLADAPNNYVTTSTINGQSIDIPSAGMFNYSAIQAYVRTQLKDPYITKEDAPIDVLNGTTQPGLATATTAELKPYGYNVINTADAPTTGYAETTVVDLSGGKDPYTKHYLEQRFSTTAVTKLPDNTIQANGADFVIIVGSDDQTTTSQG